MRLPDFRLESYFAEYEFSVDHLLCPSDCEPVPMAELLALADDADREDWERLSLGYTETRGDPELRRRIAATYDTPGPDDILTGAPQELIYLAMQELLEPGQRMVCLTPAYQSLFEVARAAGCAVDFWPLLDERDARGGTRWSLDWEALERLLPGAALLVVNFPHNPTGFLPTEDEFRRLTALAAEHGARLFSDEMYRGLEFAERPRLPAAVDLDERAVSLSGLSKAHGLAGLRCGWLASRDPEAIARTEARKLYTTICSPGPVEALSRIALANAEALEERCRDIVAANAATAEAFCARHADAFAWAPPLAGSVCFPELLGQDADAFCARAVADAGILLLPASIVGHDSNRLRLGLGRRSLPRGLDALDRFLRG